MLHILYKSINELFTTETHQSEDKKLWKVGSIHAIACSQKKKYKTPIYV